VQDVYIYNDHKVFQLEVMKVLQYIEHLRAIENLRDNLYQPKLLYVYEDFFTHGVASTQAGLRINYKIYIIEGDFLFIHLD